MEDRVAFPVASKRLFGSARRPCLKEVKEWRGMKDRMASDEVQTLSFCTLASGVYVQTMVPLPSYVIPIRKSNMIDRVCEF